MSELHQKSAFEELPLDLKVEILESLDSLYDFDNLRLTCRTFYGLSETEIWIAAQRYHYSEDVGTLLRALATLKAYARTGKIKTLGSPYPFYPCNPSASIRLNPTTNTEYIKELAAHRKIAQWFTRRFFKFHPQQFGTLEPGISEGENILVLNPSRDERMRIERAFLMQWLYAEITYIFIKNKPNDMKTLEKFVPGDTHGLQVPVNLGVLANVQNFLMELVAPMVVRFVGTQPEKDTIALAKVVPCLDLYHRRGIPNIMSWQLGLDGLKDFLESEIEARHAKISELYSHATDYNPTREYEGQYIGHFARVLDGIWEMAGVNPGRANGLQDRPLWKQKDGIYRYNAAPWNQNEGFELAGAFCDNERLESLGFFYPEFVQHDPVRWQDKDLEDQLKMRGCECPEEWECAHKWRGRII
ncbi:hypothetical protein H072_8678 [Dactylellina haptotyla CBS 200.50]|uniref:F-box domain-containing protein n=1 Tax=Dactylellina haptotyla (strain CBS 200.50) TaxID=1284197 RepID=S8BEG8_DACHA|nr:hypothetical protein H072_8678 [Dactylellina haptotyla CBS 200.50]